MIEIQDYDEPIVVAEKLINARTKRKCGSFDKMIQKAFTGQELDEVEVDTFSDEDLKEIADHLMLYVKRQEGGYDD